MSRPGSYSSQSYSPASRSGALKSQATGPNLDPRDQSAKTAEKDQMVGLNDKFVAFIDKVKHLEDQNKVLETRLRILQGQEDYEGKINEVVQEMEADLLRQVENLTRDRLKLEAELDQCQDQVEDSKQKYEVEFLKKTDLENEFMITKKDVDNGHLSKVDLALVLEDSMGELEFLRLGYQEEIKELESQVQNETVMVPDDSRRALDMDEIIANVKSQYHNMAARSREEAELWNQKKMDAMVLSAGKHDKEVRYVKKDLAEMMRLIQRLRGELENLQKKKDSLERALDATEAEGQKSLAVTRGNMAQLEEARRRAKQDMTLQVREYQELMNVKLALDIEIATYRQLLEGEEKRMNDHMRQ